MKGDCRPPFSAAGSVPCVPASPSRPVVPMLHRPRSAPSRASGERADAICIARGNAAVVRRCRVWVACRGGRVVGFPAPGGDDPGHLVRQESATDRCTHGADLPRPRKAAPHTNGRPPAVRKTTTPKIAAKGCRSGESRFRPTNSGGTRSVPLRAVYAADRGMRASLSSSG